MKDVSIDFLCICLIRVAECYIVIQLYWAIFHVELKAETCPRSFFMLYSVINLYLIYIYWGFLAKTRIK